MRHAMARAALLATLAAVSSAAAGQIHATQMKVDIPAGTRLLVRTVDSVDSEKQQAGHRFTANLETNLTLDDTVVAPRGTPVHGRLTNAQAAGRMSGGGNLTLELTDIIIHGTAYPIVTGTYEVRSKGKGEKTAKRIIGGAGLGALIGGIAGGGMGAGIGAASGAALGTTVSAATKGKQVSVPSESLLEFQLAQPASIPVSNF